MNSHIRPIAAITGVLLCMAASGHDATAQTPADTPIITFKTNIYDQYGAENAFHFVLGASETDYFDIDCGFGTAEYEVSPAYFDSESQSMTGTTIVCRVSPEGIVKVYGDPAKIDYIDAEGCYIDWIEMDGCTNIEILDLSHNELKRLDLTPFSKLQALYLSDNTFSAETPLKVGPNKPGLTILELDIIDHLDQSFNLSDYPSLVSFDAYHNRDLRNIDPTGCPDLMVMSLELTDVASLDVSKNSRLTRLNISDTRITDIDVSNNPALTNLLAQHTSGSINTDVRLSSVDVSSNPNLTLLNLVGNDISHIDLSNNPALINLNLRRNRLSSIDLGNNPNLYAVDLAYNDFDFVTLPLPQDGWGEYYYQRDPMPCSKSYAAGTAIDFSDRVLRNGYDTYVRVMLDTPDAEPVELDESFYTYAEGKVTFNEIPADSVYIEFACNAFTDYTISSALFKVKDASEMGLPNKTLSFTTTSAMAGKEITFKAGLDGASEGAPREFFVDVNGERTSFSATTAEDSDAGQVIFTGHKDTALYIDWRGDGTEYIQYPVVDETYTPYSGQTTYAGANVKVYTYESPDDISVFSISNIAMTQMDASGLKRLIAFTADGAGLDEESLVLPTESDLRELNLSGNHFSRADFSQTFPNLVTLALSGNAYENFDASKYPSLGSLYISSNNLSSLTFGGNNRLWELMADGNKLEEITFEGCPSMSQVNLSANKLKTIDLSPVSDAIRVLDIARNEFTFATLPVQADYPLLGVYYYRGQANLAAECAGGRVDLSSQAMVNGSPTTYKWYLGDVEYDADNGVYTGEALYSDVDDPDNPEFAVNDGVTSFYSTFDNHLTGVLTNDLFPNLTLLTVPVTVDEAAGIENVTADGADPDAPADVFTVSGVRILTKATPEAIAGLAPGLYIIKTPGHAARKHVVR